MSQHRVAQNCESVSEPDCPVSDTIYGYRPDLGANAFFIAMFAILAVVHLGATFRWKTWFFGGVMVAGCLGEGIGYAGRVILNRNPVSSLTFLFLLLTELPPYQQPILTHIFSMMESAFQSKSHAWFSLQPSLPLASISLSNTSFWTSAQHTLDYQPTYTHGYSSPAISSLSSFKLLEVEWPLPQMGMTQS